MTLDLQMDQFERLASMLEGVKDHQADARTNWRLMQQEMQQLRGMIAEFKVGADERGRRITELEKVYLELRGAWKLIITIASAVGAVVGWAVQYVGNQK